MIERRCQLLDSQRQFREMALDFCPRLGAETVKRLRHEIIADAEAGQGAFGAIDAGVGMLSNLIKRIADLHDLRVQLHASANVAGGGRFVKLNVKPGKNIGAAGNAAVAARHHRLSQEFLRPD